MSTVAALASKLPSPCRNVLSQLCRGLLNQHRLDVELDANVITDEDAAGFQGGVPIQTEVFAVDPSMRGVADPHAAPWVGNAPFEAAGQRHVARNAVDREFAVDHEVVRRSVDPRALEAQLG